MSKVRERSLRIRGHHFLCLNFYRGIGHGPEFVRNVREILKKARTTRVRVVSGCDDVCSACPHLHGGKCQKRVGAEEEVIKMDIEVMRRLGLSVDSLVDFGDVFELVKKEIKPLDVEEICGDCEWMETCIEASKKRIPPTYSEATTGGQTRPLEDVRCPRHKLTNNEARFFAMKMF